MRELENKRKVRKIIYSYPAIIVALFILFILGRAAINAYYKEKLSSENLERVMVDYNKLNDRQALLLKSVETLETPEGIESEIRKKFRVVKKGESIVIVVDDRGSSTASSTASSTEKVGVWSKVKTFFLEGNDVN